MSNLSEHIEFYCVILPNNCDVVQNKQNLSDLKVFGENTSVFYELLFDFFFFK